MKLKKSPKASLEGEKLTYLLMGLIVALSLMFIGLEWTKSNVQKFDVADVENSFEEEIEDVIQTNQDMTPPPPPPPAPDVIEEIEVVDNSKETKTIEINTEDDKDKKVEVIAPPVQVKEEEEDDDQVIFVRVEKQAEFPGGPAKMMEYLSKNVKYPVVCLENGIQGKAICQFTVNKDGSIVDVEVVRSSGDDALDKEAIRVIKTMPKWKPGQQRGKSVRSKFTLPVVFRLQS